MGARRSRGSVKAHLLHSGLLSAMNAACIYIPRVKYPSAWAGCTHSPVLRLMWVSMYRLDAEQQHVVLVCHPTELNPKPF